MTISTALSSAMSGLSAVGRATDLVSENIANALTPGYGRRTLSVTSNPSAGPGVQVIGVVRHSDPVLTANRRAADAEHSAADATAGFYDRMSFLVGTPDDPGSISALMSGFENSLTVAASRPDSSERLNDVVISANTLTRQINAASEGLRDMRTGAEQSIGNLVDRLNSSLRQVQDVNRRITATRSSGQGTAALEDQRQLLIDEINAAVPVTVAPRPNGQIALYSEGGAILLDGRSAEIGFSPVRDTMPQMTVGNGGLSGLTINGIPVRTDSDGGPLRGGELGAQFTIRDELAVDVQQSLDAMARDLIERFQAAGLDTTLPAGAPGLFTDGGSALDPAQEVGLAGRISVNAVVDPAEGGESWHLRDGLGASSPGSPGDASLLNAFHDVLTTSRVLSSGNFGTAMLDAGQVSADLVSRIGLDLNTSQDRLGFASASLTELSRIELAQGVDTDAEMQSLLVLEQAYAANAKVIDTVNNMMDTLLGL